MTTRTWVGGGDNSAGNPNDWSPTGLPQPGDLLEVSGAAPVIYVHGRELAGDTLYAANLTMYMSQRSVANVQVGGGHAVFDETQHSTLNLLVLGDKANGVGTVNLSGTNALNLDDEGTATVNLSPGATWSGHFNAFGYHGVLLTINAGAHSRFINEGLSSATYGANVVVPTAVLGSGEFQVSSHAHLEFSTSVAAGQTVFVSDTVLGGFDYGGGHLKIDNVKQFHALAVLSYNPEDITHNGFSPLGPPEIDLAGIANADSYSFQNDMLKLFNHDRVVGQLRLHDETSHGFAVEKTTGGVSVIAISDPAHPPVGLPLHAQS